MLGSSIQTLIMAPREELDPRIAQTDHSRLQTGSDGILYKLTNSRDWERFQVLSDQAVSEELRRSQEVKENMMMATGSRQSHGSSTRRRAHDIRGLQFVPPQLGTASRTRKIANRAWHNEMQSALLNKPMEAETEKDHSPRGAIGTLVANTDTPASPDNSPRKDVPTKTFDYTHLSRDSNNGDNVSRTFNVLKQKYEQNLYVVDKLFDEKAEAERYAAQLEQSLMQVTGLSSTAELQSLLRDKDHLRKLQLERDRLVKVLAQHSEDDDVSAHAEDVNDHEQDAVASSLRPPQSSRYDPQSSSLSATEMAALFDNEPTVSRGDMQSRPLRPPATSASISRRPNSAPRASRSQSATRAARTSSASPQSRGRRASSATRRSTTDGLSASLQADTDRYLQKLRLLDERDRQAKEEEEQHLLYLEQRRLRAAKHGGAFTDMQIRSDAAKAKQQAKMDQLKRQETNEQRQFFRDRKEQARQKDEQLQESLRTHVSWKEYQEMEAANRRERIERRKMEVQLQSSLPKSIEENLQRAKTRKEMDIRTNRSTTSQDPKHKPFKAEDPQVVRERLQRKRHEWEERLAEEKLKLRTAFEEERRASGVIDDVTGQLAKTDLELRYETYKVKREEKAKAAKDKEDEEARKKLEKEKAHRDRLLAQQIPKSSLKSTVKTEKQRELVHQRRQQEEMEKKAEREKLRRKDVALKEAGAALRVIVREEDMRLKSGNPSYLELAKTEQLAEEKAKQAREEYRAKLRENKRKLQDSLKSRPSLIERHEKSIATRDASSSALKTIANVAVASQQQQRSRRREEGKSEGDSEYSDDDADDDSWLKGKHSQTGSKPLSRKGSTESGNKKNPDLDLLDDILNQKEKLLVGVK